MKESKKVKELSKAELIELARKNGYFKKKSVKEIFARGNGHFYYTVPPKFIDEFTTHRIKREDIEVKPAVKKAPAVKKEETKK